MAWKFWNTKRIEKKFRPKELPQAIGQYLIVKLNNDPDWVGGLRAVLRQSSESISTYNIRIFEKKQATLEGAVVKDYRSLDHYPELIFYEGRYNEVTGKFLIEEKGLLTPKAA